MRVVSLASGSSGNATLVEAGTTAVLLDAGLNERILEARLRQVGSGPEQLQGIILTHEHGDHVSGALALAERYQIPLYADARTLGALFAAPAKQFATAGVTTEQPIHVPIAPQPVGSTWQLGALTITSFPVPHDAAAPCGYLVATGAWQMCLVTDCGAMSDGICTQMRRANLIILEANHDRERLIRGPYPQHLKQRILSPKGHLGNHEAADALYACLDDGPRWVWLAHLSKTNNTPELARSAVTTRLGSRRLRQLHLEITKPGLGPIWDSTALFAGTSGASAQ